MMTDLIVLGGGPSGVTAAIRARELGANVTLIERGRMGGTCTNDGCVPTRVLAKAARLLRDSDQFSEYGLQSSRPELDFEFLIKRTQQVVYSIHEKKQLLGRLSDLGVRVISEAGPARFVGPTRVELGNGLQLEAEKFILCVGGRARRIDFPGAEFASTHSDVWLLKKLPRSVVVVGGAATGCQLGSIFEAFGTQVTILERGPRILGLEDEVVSKVITQSFQNRGVSIVPEIETVERIDQGTGGLILTYRKGGEAQEIATEAVLLSTGWVGNLAELNLSAAGVETVGPYVRVDDFQRTSAANIFAAGDITGRMMLVQSANYEALTAAENAVLGVGARLKHQIVPHGGFTDPEYGGVGLTEAQARKEYDVEVAEVPYGDLDRAVIDGHPVGMCKLIVSQQTHRILGAHVVGEQALEVVQIAAAGMAADMWVEQLAELQIAYPTFTSILGLAARRIVRQLGVQPLSPEWQALAELPGAEWEARS
jgi:pyruvate/2-oxoglutarate dehydrogenase complex dihydrolipoamide dehydrogenase (E3) component